MNKAELVAAIVEQTGLKKADAEKGLAAFQDVVKAEILKCRGLQFDPKVADAMIKLIESDIHYVMHE